MPNRAFYNPAHSLDRAAKAHPNRVSLYYGEQEYTVHAAAIYTRQLAQLLVAQGVKEGDRVCIIARNSPYHLLLHVACARIGAVFVPISYRLSRPELAQLLAIAKPVVVVADPETAAEGVFEQAERVSGQAEGFSEKAESTPMAHFVIDDDPHAPLLASDAGLSAAEAGLPATVAGVVGVEGEQGILPRDSQPVHTRGHQPFLPRGYQAITDAKKYDGAFLTTGVENETDTALNSVRYFEGLGAILFTSGSTGKPKPVGLSHENLWWGSRNFREGFEYSNLDVELVVAPLTHIGGFNGTTVDLFSHGGTVVVVREFDPADVLYRLEKHRVAMMFGVPTIYAALMNHPRFAHTDLSAFRLPLIGGAVCSPALLRRMQEAGLPALNVWGMTETSASGCCLTAEHLDHAAGSIGRPFAHVEARIVDPESGADCDAGTVGELVLRGPNVVEEYWCDSAATEAGIRDGWLHTGDLVSCDDDGFLWVKGRLHHLINTGGEKVSPEEVMAVVGAHETISDCAVVGVSHPIWGEAIAAAVIIKQGMEAPTLEQIQEFAAHKLARYKLPKHLLVVDAFPTTANGKVDRAKLVELLKSAGIA
ncbi:class I adenylate-forming enzyme family protein [Arcanobacterium bovis]|uniref:Long-chain fatty acid--CoA ligase n=1 Tax=Arcanobacterium bovis TaxID=2529275 RepID=A0A4Q9V3V1_9ACTO|nr:AMP-binding protein [Arcanobacterium bovis]TBW23667.1 long-chain fatty acid--CoA ligase [Arcanobacterium bovis]